MPDDTPAMETEEQRLINVHDDETISLLGSGPGDTSPSIGQIAAALAKAQGEITGAEKDSTNPHFRSAYADLSSVWDACRDALSKNEIAVVQIPDETADGLFLRTMLCHSSGEWIQGRYLVRTQKQDPQGYGSGMTYARRYSLAAMVGVAPKGDDDDGESATKKTASRTTAKAVAAGNDGLHEAKAELETAKAKLLEDVNAYITEIQGATSDVALYEILNRDESKALEERVKGQKRLLMKINAASETKLATFTSDGDDEERAAIQAETEDLTGPLRAG